MLGERLLKLGLEDEAPQFKDVSIVEIGFMGNVLREFYRIGLGDGAAFDTTSGKAVKLGT